MARRTSASTSMSPSHTGAAVAPGGQHLQHVDAHVGILGQVAELQQRPWPYLSCRPTSTVAGCKDAAVSSPLADSYGASVMYIPGTRYIVHSAPTPASDNGSHFAGRGSDKRKLKETFSCGVHNCRTLHPTRTTRHASRSPRSTASWRVFACSTSTLTNASTAARASQSSRWTRSTTKKTCQNSGINRWQINADFFAEFGSGRRRLHAGHDRPGQAACADG